MKISTKGRYGVRIMADVAKNGNDSPAKITDISARQNLTLKYTEQICGILAKGGLLRSIRGAAGGYVLVKQPDKYTVLEILNCLEGDLAPVDCVNSDVCERFDDCNVRSLWTGLYKVIADYLGGVTLADLINTAPSGDFYVI